MSVLAYGNNTEDSPQIVLQQCRTIRCDRRAVYDGFAYLYTRWTIEVEGIYDPAATSYQFLGGPTEDGQVGNTRTVLSPRRGVAVGGVVGVAAALLDPAGRRRVAIAPRTDVAIRDALMRPRQRLLYTSGAVDAANVPIMLVADRSGNPQNCLIVESPFQPGNANGFNDRLDTRVYSTDADNGPQPLGTPMIRMEGTNTFRVRYAITTSINEAHLFRYKPPIVLSHLWDMHHDISQDGFNTRVISGRVVMRADVLAQQRTTPDDYRAYFFHPIPTNHQRESVKVQALDDGNRLRYQIVDREKSHNILLDNITRIEGWFAIGQSKPSFETMATNFWGRWGEGQINFGAAIVQAGMGRGDPAAFGRAGMQLWEAQTGSAKDSLPSMKLHIMVRAWGNRQAARSNILAACRAVITAKVPFFVIRILGLNVINPIYDLNNYTQRADVQGRYVDVSLSLSIPPWTTALNLLNGGDVVNGQPFGQWYVDDNGAASTIQDRAGRAFVPGRIDRGTSLEIAVSQALWNDRTLNPPQVAATRKTQGLTKVTYD